MMKSAREITNMIDMLPEVDRELAYELIRRMVLAWDPDFTKTTPEEHERFERAIDEINRGECISFKSADEMTAYFGVDLNGTD